MHHSTPIQILFANFTHNPKLIEKKPTKLQNPVQRGLLPFITNILPTKEALVREAMQAWEVIKIFSDSSAIKGNVGATAILTRAGQLHHTLHYHLRPDSEHMVHKAELIGILLAVHLVQTKANAKVSITIGVDNQAALGSSNMELNNLAHNMAREIIRQCNILKKGIVHKAHQITLQWTVGHKGIPGNELTDLEAKKAAEGLTSDKHTLPCFLRCKLTINPSAVKQKHDVDLKNK